jgi:hypothetical protein
MMCIRVGGWLTRRYKALQTFAADTNLCQDTKSQLWDGTEDHCLTKIAFGSITWTPLLPSTNSVMSTSPETLVSM